MYDVIVIGAGVTGCSVARSLAKYKLKIAVLEKELDVCEGTSKANSGIVHAGFDAEPGSLKARLNVLGNEKMGELSKELDFSFQRNGSLVLCFSEETRDDLKKLYESGLKNGVKDLKLINGDEARQIEPAVSDAVVGALYAPTGGIVCPFGLTIALAENAFVNGVEFFFDHGVEKIEPITSGYRIRTKQGVFETKLVVNAAGVYADKLHHMVSQQPMEITARKGEYHLYDKQVGNLVSHTIFQLPTRYGKGVLVTPTVHGNLLLGPTAMDIEDKEGVNTTAEGLTEVTLKAAESVKKLPAGRQLITSFAGLRAHEKKGDFIIGEALDAKGFYNVAGIESPGLTCAPVIGDYVVEQIAAAMAAEGRALEKKADFIATRQGVRHLAELSEEEQKALIAENPSYAVVVCRCETVTEGEIIDAIRRPLGAKTLDGIKRRTRAGMGRCQAGFCTPKTMELIAREWNIPVEEIVKSGKKSEVLLSEPVTEKPVFAESNNHFEEAADYDVVIIGGGPAGLAAALSAREAGMEKVLILERDKELGGILNQCIHNGFGLHTFKEELTGPEYAARFIERVKEEKIEYRLETMVVDLSKERVVTAMNREQGLFVVKAGAVILAMGCRERPRGALGIPGYRPAGIFSAGTAQRFVNVEGRMPGKEVVILGSGDIGLIMARRMTLEGAKVKAVAELMPYSGGLKRNIVQCLNDYDIPLKLSHTVVDIAGKERVEGVTLARVDENRQPIPGTEEYIPCDTLLLSVGLLPENELSIGAGVPIDPVTSGPVVDECLETGVPGVFACGNVLHVHDLVDFVSEEAKNAGAYAAAYVKQQRDNCAEKTTRIKSGEEALSELKAGKNSTGLVVPIKGVGGVRYTVPQKLRPDRAEDTTLIRFRVDNVYQNVQLEIRMNDTVVRTVKKRMVAPGEMEEIKIKKEELYIVPELKEISICLAKNK